MKLSRQEIIEACNHAIDAANWVMTLKRGTRTAQKIMNESCQKRIALLQDVLAQAKKGLQ